MCVIYRNRRGVSTEVGFFHPPPHHVCFGLAPLRFVDFSPGFLSPPGTFDFSPGFFTNFHERASPPRNASPPFLNRRFSWHREALYILVPACMMRMARMSAQRLVGEIDALHTIYLLSRVPSFCLQCIHTLSVCVVCGPPTRLFTPPGIFPRDSKRVNTFPPGILIFSPGEEAISKTIPYAPPVKNPLMITINLLSSGNKCRV